MTQYFETFAGMTTGVDPTNFTNRFDTETGVTVEDPGSGDAEDQRALTITNADSGIILQSFDDVDGDNEENIDIAIRFRCGGGGLNEWKIFARSSGSAGSEEYYGLQISTTNSMRFVRSISGSETNINPLVDTDSGGQWWDKFHDFGSNQPADEWLWVRMRVNGTGATVTLQARFWVDGQTESSIWDIDTTDTNAARIVTAGWCGVGRSGFTNTTEYDLVSMGTNGDVANLPVQTDGIIRNTQLAVQSLMTNSVTPVRNTQTAVQVLFSLGEAPSNFQTVVMTIVTAE
jgi:hypothetical protein